MQTKNRIFDDFARVASGAASSLTGFKAEIERVVRSQVERLVGSGGLVSREEFEAVQAMAAKARSEQERLAKRLDALEAAAGIKTESGRTGKKDAK